RLGRQTQDELAQRDAAGEEPDPFTGRWSYPRFPGVWSGRVLGRYRPDAAAIELYAYVIDPAHPLRAAWAPLLRLEALSVLAHEVAHHHDHTERVARGRWRAEDREAVERYAERMQHEWTRSVVLPYLRERYADEVAAVEMWVETHGGTTLRFEELADDPRITGRGGLVHGERLLWSMSAALRELAETVARGERRWECRLRFARELYFQSRYPAALAVVRRVLRAKPGEPRALLLKADALLELERHAEALEIGRALAGRAPETEHAWRVVADACARLGRWDEAEAALARRLELTAAEGLPLHLVLADRVRLRIRSGDLGGAMQDLEAIDCGGRAYLQRRVERLRAEIDTAARESALVGRGADREEQR
ncbi:MAG TPA: tetratricopeptide repeat protein, partial [Longimicrobium sp.]